MDLLGNNLGGLFATMLVNPRNHLKVALANNSDVRMIHEGEERVGYNYNLLNHVVNAFIVFIYTCFYWYVFSQKFNKPLLRILSLFVRFWMLITSICVLFYDVFLGFALIIVLMLKQGYLAYLCYKYKTFDFLLYNTILMFYLKDKKQAYTHFCDYHTFITLCGGSKHVNLNGVMCKFETLDELCLTVIGSYELILPHVRKIEGFEGDCCFIFSKEPVVSIINILNYEVESDYVAVDL